MSGFPLNGFRITSGVGELKAGYRMGGDYTRISAYGADQGIHTGSYSPTFRRHGLPLGGSYDAFTGFRHVFGPSGPTSSGSP